MNADHQTRPETDGSGAADAAPLQRFRQRCREGGIPRAEEFISDQHDKSQLIDLAYEEFCQREEAGEAIDPEAFCKRFPRYQSSLRRLFATHAALHDMPSGLLDARPARFPEPGEHLLGFQIEEELGKGAFARVYLAAEVGLGNRRVVIKVSQGASAEPGILGKLDHPNIVPVHSVQKDNQSNLTVVCMPFVGRVTLCDVLDHVDAGHLPGDGTVVHRTIEELSNSTGGESRLLSRRRYVDVIVRIGAELAEGLQFVHDQGIFHRDIKPSNVLLDAHGKPMLLDFNLSVEKEGALPLDWGGTLPYMAPEQLAASANNDKSHSVDARSDLFSLGVVLYELFTGVHPFGPISLNLAQSDLVQELLERQKRGALSIDQLNSEVSNELANLINWCLAPDVDGRPESASTLARGLRRQLTSRQRVRRWAGRNSRPLAWLSTVFFAALVAFGVWFWSRPPYNVRQLRAGLAAFESQNYPDAIAHFSESLDHADAEIDPAKVLLMRARAHLQLGKILWAHDDLSKAEQIDPKDGKIKALLGYCSNLQGYGGGAMLEYQQAKELGFAPAALYNNLGYTYLQSKLFVKARSALDQALARDDRLAAAYYNRALVDYESSMKRSDFSNGPGLADLSKAIELSPHTAELYRTGALMAANAVRDGGAPKEIALDYLARALDLGSDPALLQDLATRSLRDDPRFKALKRRPRTSANPRPMIRLLNPLD